MVVRAKHAGPNERPGAGLVLALRIGIVAFLLSSIGVHCTVVNVLAAAPAFRSATTRITDPAIDYLITWPAVYLTLYVSPILLCLSFACMKYDRKLGYLVYVALLLSIFYWDYAAWVSYSPTP